MRSHEPLSNCRRILGGAPFGVLAIFLFPVLLGARGCEYESMCADIYAPVCGEDGVTYANECEAGRVGVVITHEGECETSCVCTEEWAPVCGSDGVTYSNACFATCSGQMVAHEGECRGDCVCPAVYAPVCGSDGITYGNGCEASCVGAEIAYDGECRSECACPEIWAPVCGTDGVTYGNACEANCAGAMVVHEGACECAPVLCDLYCEFGFAIDPMTGCETCSCNEPPVRCASDFDCGPAQFCAIPPCAMPGGGPDDPSLPFECLGFCQDREPPPPPSYCRSDAECGGGRCDLIECTGLCEPGMSCTTECWGVCVGEPPPPSRDCIADSDCSMGERCAISWCTAPTDPADPSMPRCEPGPDGELVCYPIDPVCGGTCVIDEPPPPPPGPECAADSDCPAGFFCSAPDILCPPGAMCPDVLGLCEPITPPPSGECRVDADCADGSRCIVRDIGCPPGAMCEIIGYCEGSVMPLPGGI